MKTIHKYRVEDCVLMPIDATILSVHEQGESLFFWALIDTDNQMVFRNFKVFGTGWNIPDVDEETDLVYLGTAYPEPFVFHVFEEIRVEK